MPLRLANKSSTHKRASSTNLPVAPSVGVLANAIAAARVASVRCSTPSAHNAARRRKCRFHLGRISRCIAPTAISRLRGGAPGSPYGTKTDEGPLLQGAWRLWLGLRHGEPHLNVPITNVRLPICSLDRNDELAYFDHHPPGGHDALHHRSRRCRWMQWWRVLTFRRRPARYGRRSSQLHRGRTIASL